MLYNRTVLEVKSYSVGASSNGTGSTTVTLSQAYPNARVAVKMNSQSDALALYYTVSGSNVTISVRNHYSSYLSQSGEVVVYEVD